MTASIPASVTQLSAAIAAGHPRPFVVTDGVVELAVFPMHAAADEQGCQHYVARVRVPELGTGEVQNLPLVVTRPTGTDHIARAAFTAWSCGDSWGDTGSAARVVAATPLHYPARENDRCLLAVQRGDPLMFNH